MQYFVTLPDAVQTALADRGVALDTLLYTVKADLDGDGCYVDTYLAFDPQNLYVVKGYERFVKQKRSKRPLSAFDFVDYDELPLASIEKAYVDRLINSGRLLLVTRNGEHRQFCRFSINVCDLFEKFAERINKTITGEPIDDSFLSDPELRCPKCHNPYPDMKRRVCPYCANKGATLWRLVRMYSAYKKEAFLIIASIVLNSAVSIMAPYFGSKMLYDEVLAESGSMFGQVLTVVLLMIAVRVISTAMQTVNGVLVSKIAPKVNQDLRVSLLASMQRLSLSYFTTKQTGSLMSRIDHDTMDIYSLFVDMIPQFIVNLLTVVGLLIVMLLLNPLLTALLFLSISAIAAIIFLYEHHMERFYRRLHVARKTTNATVSDSLNGQRVVKAFAREEREIERFEGKNERQKMMYHIIGRRNVGNYSRVFMIYRMSQVLLFMLGACLIIMGDLTLGTLTVLISYGDMIMNSLGFFLNGGDYMARCLDAGARMFEILDAEPTVAESPHPVHVREMQGDIEFRNVTFAYEPGRPIVKGLSMHIEAGQLFGIVGRTGAGKTTLINLCCRLYDPSEGDILLDGVNLRDIAFTDLRRNIGVVSQETYLFMGTIADNIRYAKPNASIDEVIAAAKAAYAHDFIIKLADGYDTRVGSGGVSLSGGEKQRVSIARAILQQPSILVLDEATAAMDTVTERKIQAALAELRQGKTIISIAHRLSTLRDADVLAVVEDGKLAELGTHDELIHQKGKYFELHRVQSEALQFVEMGD